MSEGEPLTSPPLRISGAQIGHDFQDHSNEVTAREQSQQEIVERV